MRLSSPCARQIGTSAATTAKKVAIAATASQGISLKWMVIQLLPTLSILSVVEQWNKTVPILSESAMQSNNLMIPLHKLNYR